MNRDDDADRWVSDALASLNRPVVPEHVVRRIDAVIAATPVPPPRQPAAAPLVPEQSRGHRTSRSKPWILGLAGLAAALVVVAVADPYDSGTLPTPTDQASEIAAPLAVPPTEAQVSQVLLASQTSYTQQGLPQQVADVVQSPPMQTKQALPAPWTQAAAQSASTTRGVTTCVAALPLTGDDLVFVDRAVYEGQPVLVIARRAGAQFEVFVLRAGCTAQDTGVLLRATVEAPQPRE